jgi:hypothetical protein
VQFPQATHLSGFIFIAANQVKVKLSDKTMFGN